MTPRRGRHGSEGEGGDAPDEGSVSASEAPEGHGEESDRSSSESETSEDEHSSDEQEGVEEEEPLETPKSWQIKPVASATGEECTFDLRNLLAMNAHQINSASLYFSKKADQEENITIPGKLDCPVNEEYLLKKASDGCSQLIGALWQLPVERSDAGPLVHLPAFDESKIPRALLPPPPKKETKWEKFAKEKGIPLNKSKRSRKVWDEATGTWMYRHGYQKANDTDNKEWPIMEVKANEDPFADPWERVREAKRARVEKNAEQRMRNEERAGGLSKGTANRMLKSREKNRRSGKRGGDQDRDNVLPSGVPVDLKASSKRGRESTLAALIASQRSTASLGRFDRMREGEPEREKADKRAATKKRKVQGGSTDRKVISSEAERSLKLLKSVVEGGGAQKEKARKKGHLAAGETAYDYDYDDGLGPSTFRKKKGRAGAGKMKKVTKKRVR